MDHVEVALGQLLEVGGVVEAGLLAGQAVVLGLQRPTLDLERLDAVALGHVGAQRVDGGGGQREQDQEQQHATRGETERGPAPGPRRPLGPLVGGLAGRRGPGHRPPSG
jgi:hypothetical protein